MADLQGRELDIAIAFHVMHWGVGGANWNTQNGDRNCYVQSIREGVGCSLPDGFTPVLQCPAPEGLPHYSTSHDAICEVRAEIERRGLQNHFCSILDDMTNDDPGMLIDAWAFLNATPEQQCRAALKAVECAHA